MAHIITEETRAKISAAKMGHSVSAETRAKISAAKSNPSAETRIKLSRAKKGCVAWNRGISPSAETRAKLCIARKGRVILQETREKLSASRRGRTMPLESRAKLEKPKSPETRARISRAKMGHPVSPETRAKLSTTHWKGGPQVSKRKIDAHRRLLGFTPLNSWFPGCEGHHVDPEQVIFMPKTLHQSVYHRQTDGRGMAQINAIAYNFLFKQEAEAALAAKEASRVDGEELVTK